MARKEIHVVQEPNGGWRIERFDTDEVVGRFVTRGEAVEVARQLSGESGARLIVHEPGANEEEAPEAAYPYDRPLRKD